MVNMNPVTTRVFSTGVIAVNLTWNVLLWYIIVIDMTAKFHPSGAEAGYAETGTSDGTLVAVLVMHLVSALYYMWRQSSPVRILMLMEDSESVKEVIQDFREADPDISIWKHAGHSVGDDGYSTTFSAEEDVQYHHAVDKSMSDSSVSSIIDSTPIVWVWLALHLEMQPDLDAHVKARRAQATTEIRGKDKNTETGIETYMQGLPWHGTSVANMDQYGILYSPYTCAAFILCGFSVIYIGLFLRDVVKFDVPIVKNCWLGPDPQAPLENTLDGYPELAVVYGGPPAMETKYQQPVTTGEVDISVQ